MLPKINSTAEIVIPSVPRWEDSQSIDSRSLETCTYSFLTPNQLNDKRASRSNGSKLKLSSKGRVILRVPTDGAIRRQEPSAVHMGLLPPLPSINQAIIHRPSGDLSVSVASIGSASQLEEEPKKKYLVRSGPVSLWGGGADDTLEALEEHIKLESLAQQIQAENEREEHLRVQEEIDRLQARTLDEELVEEVEDDLDFLNYRHHRGTGNAEDELGRSAFAIGLRDSLSRLAASMAREKLRNLAKYVSGHTNRKILSCWNMIESRFKQSSVFKVVMTPDVQGLMHPVRHNALHVSALIRILCSSRVRVGNGEVSVLLERVGVSDLEVTLGLMIAALNVVVQVCAEASSDMAATYREQMLELLNKETSMVSITELRGEIFAADPMEREMQQEEIKGRKQLEVASMLAEKRKKDDMKLKQELSRKKMVDDFEKVLDQLQVMKQRVFNRICAENFLFVVDFCRKAVLEYFEELSSKVPPDLVFFLGAEHFPKAIQDKITARMKKYHREHQQKLLDVSNAQRPLSRASSSHSLSSERITKVMSVDASAVYDSPHAISRAESLRGAGDKPKTTPGFLFEFEDYTDLRVESATRVKLAGSPSVLTSLRALVALGRTFPRFSFRDMVEIMQYLAAVKIISCFRGFSKRWRYFAARMRWRKIFRGLRIKYYEIWANIVRHRKIIRQHCFRKVVSWKYYTKRMIQRREAFRLCFWPLYVWRKFSSASATAKEKAKFLVSRALPTLITLKVFHAWKKYSLFEARCKHLADNFQKAAARGQCQGTLQFWWWWAHKRRHIRHAWYRRAKAMRRKHLAIILRSRFLIWRIFIFFRTTMRKRISQQLHSFRKLLLPGRKPWKMLCYLEKKAVMAAKRRHADSGIAATRKSAKGQKAKKSTAAKRKTSDQSISSQASHSTTTSKGARVDEGPDEGGDASESDGKLALLRFSSNFLWKSNMKSWLDIDSDGEDGNDIPEHLSAIYTTSTTVPFPSLSGLPFLVGKLDSLVDERFVSTAEAYRCRDIWNHLDAAIRFHRYAFRAFANLRVYAKIKTKLRKFNQKRRRKLLAILWLDWVAYTKAGGGPLRNNDGTNAAPNEAEVLYYQVRTHMSSKLLRTRKLVAEVSMHYNKEAEIDSDNEEEKANKQMKNLNLMSDDNDDFSFVENEKRRAKQRAAEIRRKKEKMLLVFGNYQPPNMVELDDKDRRKEFSLADSMVKYSSNVTDSLKAMATKADNLHQEVVSKRERISNMVDEVLNIESSATERAVSKQQEYALKFKEHAAQKLVDVLAKVYKEVQKKLIQDESKIYFRGLRMPMLIARSKKMLNRKRLKNYVRICCRLRSLSEKAPFYHKMRTMWVVFNRWMRYLSVLKMDCTPGFSEAVERRLILHPDFHHHLLSKGYMSASYCNDDNFRRSLFDFRVLFSRWKTHCQETILFRTLREKVLKIFKLKLLRKCLWALKTGLNTRDYAHRIHFEPKCFPITRLQADVDQILKRFLPMRKRQLPTTIKKMNKMVVNRIKTLGRKAETFKSFLGTFLGQISLRVSTEQRLLHEAFEARGRQDFVDIFAPFKHHPVLPPIMTKLEGKAFFDPHVNPKDLSEPTIPAGFRLSRIKWAVQASAANGSTGASATLLGWQLVWSADGAPEVESAQRGHWHSAGISVVETIIPKEDFMVGLEYMYDGPTIVGVRMKLFQAGFTKWVGGKTSLSTLSVYLGADEDIAETLPFELDRKMDRDEENFPALPNSMVIGLSGLVHNNHTTNIGLVVRKIRKQNVFSYFWVQDVLESNRMQNTDFGGFTVANGVDAQSVPSNLQLNTDTPPGDESITLDNSYTEADGGLDESALEGAQEEDDIGEASLEASLSASERRNQRMAVPRIARKFAKWMEQDETGVDHLTSPETQFFDILRMRMTELSSAKTRADEFARRIWTSREIRTHPVLSKLVSLRIVAQLTRWFFNAISRRLIPFCITEKRGLYLVKLSRRLDAKAKTLIRRARNNRNQASALETSRHSWDGKPALGPQERAAKKLLFLQVAELRAVASKFEVEADQIMLSVKENEDLGTSFLPKISLNLTVYNNFKTKIAAARHKESLLERMSLDQIKNGLFGSNMKETLLNKDQMQAIHASLRDRVIVMKDTSSLQRLVDNVLETEQALVDAEQRSGKSRGRSSHMQVITKGRSASTSGPVARSLASAGKPRLLRGASKGSQMKLMTLSSSPSHVSSALNSLSYDDNDNIT